MKIATKALEDQGYEVVNFNVTDEEYELGAMYAYGIILNGSFPGLVRDSYREGENLTKKSKGNFFLFDLL